MELISESGSGSSPSRVSAGSERTRVKTLSDAGGMLPPAGERSQLHTSQSQHVFQTACFLKKLQLVSQLTTTRMNLSSKNAESVTTATQTWRASFHRRWALPNMRIMWQIMWLCCCLFSSFTTMCWWSLFLSVVVNTVPWIVTCQFFPERLGNVFFSVPVSVSWLFLDVFLFRAVMIH